MSAANSRFTKPASQGTNGATEITVGGQTLVFGVPFIGGGSYFNMEQNMHPGYTANNLGIANVIATQGDKKTSSSASTAPGTALSSSKKDETTPIDANDNDRPRVGQWTTDKYDDADREIFLAKVKDLMAETGCSQNAAMRIIYEAGGPSMSTLKGWTRMANTPAEDRTDGRRINAAFDRAVFEKLTISALQKATDSNSDDQAVRRKENNLLYSYAFVTEAAKEVQQSEAWRSHIDVNKLVFSKHWIHDFLLRHQLAQPRVSSKSRDDMHGGEDAKETMRERKQIQCVSALNEVNLIISEKFPILSEELIRAKSLEHDFIPWARLELAKRKIPTNPKTAKTQLVQKLVDHEEGRRQKEVEQAANPIAGQVQQVIAEMHSSLDAQEWEHHPVPDDGLSLFYSLLGALGKPVTREGARALIAEMCRFISENGAVRLPPRASFGSRNTVLNNLSSKLLSTKVSILVPVKLDLKVSADQYLSLISANCEPMAIRPELSLLGWALSAMLRAKIFVYDASSRNYLDNFDFVPADGVTPRLLNLSATKGSTYGYFRSREGAAVGSVGDADGKRKVAAVVAADSEAAKKLKKQKI